MIFPVIELFVLSFDFFDLQVCAQCARTVSDDNLFPTTNELKRKAYHKD